MEIMDVEYLYSVQYPNTLVGILKVLLIVWVLEDKNNFWFLLETKRLRLLLFLFNTENLHSALLPKKKIIK